jgi:hypothetical protein
MLRRLLLWSDDPSIELHSQAVTVDVALSLRF